MKKTGIKFATAQLQKQEFAVEVEVKYPLSQYSWTIGGPYYDRTPEVSSKVERSISLDEINIHGTKMFFLSAAGQNLLDDGYTEYPFSESMEGAIKKACALHGEKIDLRGGLFHSTTYSGREEIDGTGVLLVENLINRHSPSTGGRLGGGWD
jgi:hypothetical protein